MSELISTTSLSRKCITCYYSSITVILIKANDLESLHGLESLHRIVSNQLQYDLLERATWREQMLQHLYKNPTYHHFSIKLCNRLSISSPLCWAYHQHHDLAVSACILPFSTIDINFKAFEVLRVAHLLGIMPLVPLFQEKLRKFESIQGMILIHNLESNST